MTSLQDLDFSTQAAEILMADQKTEELPVERTTVSPGLPAVTEAERELAQQATEEFDNGNYDACANLLQKLSTNRAADPRLIHNRAVVEFYRSGCSKTDEYMEAIAESQVDVNNLSALDDVDQCSLFYNHAVLLYHMRQYKAALAVMDKLFTFIEPMDRKIGSTSSGYFGLHATEEGLSRKVVFLLIELYLCVQQPEKAMGMITLAEKSLLGNGKSQQGSGDKEGSKEKEPSKEKEGKDSVSDAVNDPWKPKLSLHRARCYMMLKSMKSCKREVKSLMNAGGLATPTIYLKANFEYLRGNYRKAIKVLNTTSSESKPVEETGEALPVMYYNNLGVIHFYLKKHHLGAFYFRKAIEENERMCSEFHKEILGKKLSGRPAQTLGMSRHYELLYNLGVQLLHCGKPLAAFDCLIETAHIFQVNPRLWLRLSECCIMAHRTSNDDNRSLEDRLKVVVGTIGSGIHKKVLLGSGVPQKNPSSDSAAIPSATLEFAALCLRNALVLLPEDPLDSGTTNTEEHNDNKSSGENILVVAPPGNPLKSSEVINLRCTILAACAYISLILRDHLMALHYAEKLLKQPKLSGAHRYLGHMYMGEALTLADRIADAVSHLNPEQVSDVSTIPPEHRVDQEKSEKNGERDPQETNETKGALYPWSPRDVQRARSIMQYNLATAHAICGEYEKAMTHLRKSTENAGNPLPVQMYFLKIYVELMESGRRKVTQGILKEHFSHLPQNRI